jgi:hypothetical protein
MKGNKDGLLTGSVYSSIAASLGLQDISLPVSLLIVPPVVFEFGICQSLYEKGSRSTRHQALLSHTK